MISSQVPLAMAPKTLRRSKLSITVDTYGHLVPYAAQTSRRPDRRSPRRRGALQVRRLSRAKVAISNQTTCDQQETPKSKSSWLEWS
jgi:hypothetical protein